MTKLHDPLTVGAGGAAFWQTSDGEDLAEQGAPLVATFELVDFCSGYGQTHSAKAERNARPYVGIAWQGILEMIENPPQVDKAQGQWAIFSTLPSRVFAEQREQGKFYVSWHDFDENAPGVDAAAHAATQATNSDVHAYSSRSATEEKPKCRVLLPLVEPIDGRRYELLQECINDRLEAAGLVPDRVTERAGQLCYLPNRGELYEHTAIDWNGPLDWRTEFAEELAAKERELAEQEAEFEKRREALVEKRKQREAQYTAGQVSPIQTFRDNYTAQEAWESVGARMKGRRALSPLSDSGSPAITFSSDGVLWHSHHGSDREAGIGTPDRAAGGCWGDAFDVFVHFQHGGDFTAALKAAGDMFTIGGVTITKHNQRAHMEEQARINAGSDFSSPAGCEDADGDQEGEKKPEPVDIFGTLEPPAFPVHRLPRSLAAYTADQAELLGVDPGIIGMAGLTVIAACIDDRIRIQPKRFDPTWTESARIWSAPVGDPSAMKSPALAKAMNPAKKIDAKWRKEGDEAYKKYQREHAKWEKRAAKEDDPGPAPELPPMNRLIYEDTTVEKLGDLLAMYSPRGALVFNDELSGWLSSMDAYKNGGSKDRAAWLEAYNGGPKSIDRVKRGSTYVENWSACVLGGIQPSVIQDYAKVTNHDGMLQRFIVYFARPAEEGVDRWPDMDAKQRYEDLVEHIVGITAGSEPVKLSEEAHAAKEALWSKITAAVKLHPNPYLVAALGKWKGTYARLLLTFHVIECAERGVHPSAERVNKETAENVASLLWDCLLVHAVRFYQELDEVGDKARAVAGLVLARGWERFTVKRDLDRYMRASRKWKPWEVDETMQRLESFGWILPVVGKLNERGRPAAYQVNPLVHERFKAEADKERERREEVAKLMGELAG
ncbi:DUF3987 domain-containing protein [Halomonas sp. PGE1]|uniref:DUF3987 domain-containing protein n=1 Tax=Halomonas sp. PGE1 TaxID=2730360 RepID=UPI001B8BD95F|nr:DUF3987 domain-containing protein [Halomonas sp. PGE1]